MNVLFLIAVIGMICVAVLRNFAVVTVVMVIAAMICMAVHFFVAVVSMISVGVFWMVVALVGVGVSHDSPYGRQVVVVRFASLTEESPPNQCGIILAFHNWNDGGSPSLAFMPDLRILRNDREGRGCDEGV